MKRDPHKVDIGGGPRKLTVAQVREIRATVRRYGTRRMLARRYGVSEGCIGNIIAGTRYREA